MYGQNDLFSSFQQTAVQGSDLGYYIDDPRAQFETPAPEEVDPREGTLLKICFGLRSPNFENRREAAKKFADLLPKELVEGNAFIDALNAEEPREDEFFVQTVKDAVEFLTNATNQGDVWMLKSVEEMASIGYFFKALGRTTEVHESAEIRKQQYEMDESFYKIQMEILETQKADMERNQKAMEEMEEKMKLAELDCKEFEEALQLYDDNYVKMEEAYKVACKQLNQFIEEQRTKKSEMKTEIEELREHSAQVEQGLVHAQEEIEALLGAAEACEREEPQATEDLIPRPKSLDEALALVNEFVSGQEE